MIDTIITYKKIIEDLPKKLANSPYKKNYIIKEIGMTTPTFYRKLKQLSFTADEMLAIAKLVNPEEAALTELRESIQKGKKDIKNGNSEHHNQIISSLNSILQKKV